jgi:hypothetical protein
VIIPLGNSTYVSHTQVSFEICPSVSLCLFLPVCVCLFVCLLACLPACKFIRSYVRSSHPSVCLPSGLPVQSCVCPTVRLPACMPVFLSAFLPVCLCLTSLDCLSLSVCLSLYVCLCLPVSVCLSLSACLSVSLSVTLTVCPSCYFRLFLIKN